MESITKSPIEIPTDNVEGQQETFESIINEVNSTGSDVINLLNSTNPAAKDEFLENPALAVPNNTHNKLKIDEVQEKLAKIEQIFDQLPTSGISEKERHVVEFAAEDNKRKNIFLLANANYNAAPTEANAELHRYANEALYGKPDQNVFLSLLNESIDKIEGKDLTDEEMRELTELKGLLGPIGRPEVERFKPKPETVERFSGMVKDFFEPVLKHIPENQETFTIQEAAEITDQILKDILPEESEWSAEYEADRISADVSQHTKTINFPGKRPAGDYTRKDLEKIIVHEFGTHAMRAIPYEDSSVEMFRTGLPGYASFEEGVAKVMEQAMDGKYTDSGVDHYISIGLANFMKTDFRKTYEIQRRLIGLRGGKNPDGNAFKTVQRAFRGTDRLPNNKDLVYYNGTNQVWKFIEDNIDDAELFDHLFLSGKTDFTNKDHERIAYEAKVGSF